MRRILPLNTLIVILAPLWIAAQQPVPILTSISPASGIPGTSVSVTLAGANFTSDATVSSSNSAVTVSNVAVVSSAQINASFAIAPSATLGTANITVATGGGASGPVNFTTLPPPVVSAISPTLGMPGTSVPVTMSGMNFVSVTGAYLLDVAADFYEGVTVTNISVVSTTQITATFTIAANAPLASLVGVACPAVTTASGVGYCGPGALFSVGGAATWELSPSSGPVGTAVTIAGVNFGTTQGSSTVTFNGSAAAVYLWSDTTIKTVVPSGLSINNYATVVVTNAGVASNRQYFYVTAPPSPTITNTWPTSGPAGTAITISGSNFGAAQGSSTVSFGGVNATTIPYWSDTSLTVLVPTGALTGNVVVTVNGVSSSGAPFTVTNPPVLTSVSPTSGAPGANVTITGTGFGSQQGIGQVWLGSTYGTVVSWSDTQIVATIAPTSRTGTVKVLQSGVWSNSQPFTVNTVTIDYVFPTSGPPGTVVTVAGSNFGAVQGTGSVQLGSTAGVVVTWSDTQIVATVAESAISGIAQVQQTGILSNAVTFTVTGSSGATTMAPNILNMVVGDTRTLQALDGSSHPVGGLAWTSSDPTIVSLSTDDPPVLTALAPGHVTITAGGASADVTVWPDALPAGTVLWSNPGNGSGVSSIVPAVPSASGVADMFAFQADGTVAAITADGLTAWTADVSNANVSLADFQGGLVLWESVNGTDQITKVDGLTGLKRVIYTLDSTATLTGYLAVHPDGTVFICQQNETSDYHPLPWTVVGIDSAAGGQKFSVTIPRNGSLSLPFAFIIAGDGYAYTGYMDAEIQNGTGMDGPFPVHIELIRVDSSGASDTLAIKDYTTTYRNSWWGEGRRIDGAMITNADQGVLLSWTIAIAEGGTNYVDMAVTNGSGWTLVNGQMLPDQHWAPVPVLQAQDGSYVGTASVMTDPTGSPAPYMVAFDQSGSLRWSVAGNYQPRIATADGGVVATDDSGAAVTFDQNGNATGQIGAWPTYSWMGNAYQQQGSVEQICANLLFVLYDVASSFWAVAGANYSDNATAFALVRTFSDNEASSNVTVSNSSQMGANQQTITNVLADILQALNSDRYAGCSAWLTGAARFSVSDYVTALITNNSYGHGLFNDNTTAAITGGKNGDGTLVGVPATWVFTVNDTGAFFNAKLGDKTFTVGRRAYTGGTLRAQAAILIHELGHQMVQSGGADGFQHDAGNKPAGRANDKLVDENCGRLIGGLK